MSNVTPFEPSIRSKNSGYKPAMKVVELVYSKIENYFEEGIEPPFAVLEEAPTADSLWPPKLRRTIERLMKNPERCDELSFYISTQVSFATEERGQTKFRNRKDKFSALMFFILDDIGTKVDRPTLNPTWVVETSAHNFQYSYMLRVPIEDREYAERFIRTIYQSDKTDRGGNLVGKFVRLPAGRHGKLIDGEPNPFQVRLKKFNPEVEYDPEEILEAFGLELLPPKSKMKHAEFGIKGDGEKDPDIVLQWMKEAKWVLEEDKGQSPISIRCPNYKEHTDKEKPEAGYFPLYRGATPGKKMTRGFNCFHDHCEEKGVGLNFLLEKIANIENGPIVTQDPELEVSLQRYVFVEEANEVRDLWSSRIAIEYGIPMAGFQNARRKQVLVSIGEDGEKYRRLGEAWLESPSLKVVRSCRYMPETKERIAELEGNEYFNTYWSPKHEKTDIEPKWFLDHIRFLVPKPEEREVFLDWLAYKIQNPHKRSYGVLMVAPGNKWEDESKTFGIGRTMLGQVIEEVLQAGVETISSEDILVKTGQSEYTEWLESNQLIIVNETKETTIEKASDGERAYNRLREVIDPTVQKNARIKTKYGKNKRGSVYCIFLFFSNHLDALRLPGDDRRLFAIHNPAKKRPQKKYEEMLAAIENPAKVAQVFWWLMNRDVSEFKPASPPMTDLKQMMIRSSVTYGDELMDAGKQKIKGDLVTKRQLLKAVMEAAKENDEEITEAVEAKMAASVTRMWKMLDVLSEGDPNGGRIGSIGPDGRKNESVRIIRNVEKWRKAFKMDKQRQNRKICHEELEKTEREITSNRTFLNKS